MKVLPFLKNVKEGAVSVPADAVKRKADEDLGSDADLLETVLEELFSAKTGKARAEAFRAAFQLLEQEPHEEISHG